MRKELANVSKRGNSYQIRVSCGYSNDGKQNMRCKTWTPDLSMTPRQIQKELENQVYIFEKSCNQGQESSFIKFSTFSDQWFEEYAKLNLRSTTRERIKQLQKRVYDYMGNLYIGKISVRAVQNFINYLALDAKSENTGKHLSRKTVIHYLSFISDVFSYAIRLGILTDNPCKNVIIPKNLDGKKEKKVYSVEETITFLKLLDQFAPLKYVTFFKLLIYGGLRRSEALGLEWKDIDFENKIISIRRTSNYTAEKGVYTDKTKTKSSERTLQLPEDVFSSLLKYRYEQKQTQKELGSKWIDYDRLFVKWNGLPMNNQTPYGWLKEFCGVYKFPFYGLHTFRHLNASLLINAGVDVVAVSSALGHSQVSTTLNIYSHAFSDMKSKTCKAISESLKLK